MLATMRIASVLTLTAGLFTFTALAAPADASAAPNVKRTGGQFEGMFGASLCIPGKGDCKSADTVSGKTGPSFGMGFTLGFRPIKYLLIGGAYNLGFFNPDYRDGAADVYKSAYQNSLFGVVRAIIPIWRVDIGLELAQKTGFYFDQRELRARVGGPRDELCDYARGAAAALARAAG